jgi:broad specificity phosphatase PhoE
VEGVAYLIRHAKAGDRGAWQGPDELRPLTKGGARQADGLAERLGGEPIARVISSPAVRCLDTVRPLAERLGVEVEQDPDLMEGMGPGDAARLVAGATAGSAVVLCTHGDVIWELLTDLEVAGVPLTAGIPAKKGSVWVLDVADGAVVRGTYRPPPEV